MSRRGNEPGLEDEAADALLALLREVAPDTRFVKRPVLKTKSPNFVSLFLTGLPPEP